MDVFNPGQSGFNDAADFVLNSGYVLGGTYDPTSTPTYGAKGAIWVQVAPYGVGAVGVFQKQDDGKTTNWSSVGGGPVTTLLQNVFFVAKNGNDATADGSVQKPYLTVQAAINAASLVATPTNRPCVFVMPGTYTETYTLKANVLVKGMGFNQTRLIGTWVLDGTFTPAGDHRSGWADVGLFSPGTITLDFLGLNSNEGKVYAWNVRFGGTVTATSFSSINQFIVFGGELFGLVTLNGMNTQFNGTVVQNNASVVCNHFAGGSNTLVTAGGSFFNITINALVGTFSGFFGHNAQSAGQLTLNGTGAVANAAANSIPRKNLVNFLGGALESQLIRTNDAFGLAFTPTTPANYPVGTDTVQKALDALSVGGSYTEEVVYKTISPAEFAAKQITLAIPTVDVTKVLLFAINGPAQEYLVDFTMLSPLILSWNGLGLDGIIDVGDKFLIVYPK